MEARFAICQFVLLFTTCTTLLGADKQERQWLKTKRLAGAVDRVDATLEVRGNLKVLQSRVGDAKNATAVKMSAAANLLYVEKSLGVGGVPGPLSRAIRHYEQAKATIHVGDGEFAPTLRDQRRLIEVDIQGSKVVLFSPRGPLTREELDLVDLQGNSLILDRLLPARQVAVGDSWKHPDKLLGALCGLETVDSSDAQSVLQSVADGLAQIEMAGYVSGVVNGLSSTIQVKAKYRFDAKLGRITWFALLIKESREAGATGPGLDVVARVQIKVTPQSKSQQLAEAALQGVSLEPTTDLQQLAYLAPQAGWEMTHDRRWILISESKELTVLRMAEGAAYLAQCNVSAMAPGEAKEVTLAEFQETIREGLGKNFHHFVKASQSATEVGYRLYRVAAQGEVSGVPIDWIYYRLADKSGRQLIVLFTVEANMAEQFQESDRDLIRTVRLSEPKVAANAQSPR